MRLATVPLEEGADASSPVTNVCQPAAVAQTEPLPGGTGLPVRGDPGRPAAGGCPAAAAGGDRPPPTRGPTALADGEAVATVCADLGCSRASLFRWRARHEADGLAGLLDRPRTGRASELPPAIERLVLTVRLLTYWNTRRIAAEFRRRGVWPLSHGQGRPAPRPPGERTARATSGRPARATSERP
jgi:transposase-like protein